MTAGPAFASLGDEQFVFLTTFRRSGEQVSTLFGSGKKATRSSCLVAKLVATKNFRAITIYRDSM